MNANPRDASDFAAQGVATAQVSAALLGAAFDSHPDAHTILDSTLRVVWANSASRAAFAARGIDDPSGLDWCKIKPHAADREQWYSDALVESRNIDFPHLVTPTSDGQLRYHSLHIRALGREALLVIERDTTPWVRSGSDDQQRLQRLHALCTGGQDTVAAIDCTGKIICHSPSLSDLLGYGADEYVGRNLFEFWHPDDLPESRRRLASGMTAEQPRQMRELQARFRHRDGRWIWLRSLVVNALRDPHLGAIICYVHDCTERVAIDAQIEFRERRLSALMEKSDDMIVVVSKQGKLNFESVSVRRILGYPQHELTVARVLRLVHRHCRPALLAAIAAMRQPPAPEYRFECMIRAADGSFRWLEVVCVDLRGDPDVAGVLVTARDVTARKDIEIERDTVIEYTDVCLWEQDRSSRAIRWLNPGRFTKLLWLQKGNHTEREFYDSVHPNDRAQVLLAYNRLEREEADEVQLEYRMRGIDGGWRWLFERARLAGANPRTGGDRIVGVWLDITKQCETQHQLASAKQHFERAFRAAQVEYFEWDLLTDTVTGLDDWCERNGLPAQSTRGHEERWDSYIHPEDLPRVDHAFKEHLAGHTSYFDSEYRIRCGDGRYRWLLDRVRVTERGVAGNALRLSGIIMDIDARKSAELALRATESRLATAIWGASFGLWEMDASTRKARWFSDWCEREDLAACDSGDHVASWDANIHPDDLRKATELFSLMQQGSCESFECEYRIRTQSGAWKWIFERSRVADRDAKGNPRTFTGICFSIDQRKQAEAALRKSETLYRGVASLTPGYVVEYRVDSRDSLRITWTSEGFEEIFGMTLEEFYQGDWRRHYRNDDEAERRRQQFLRVLQGEQVDAEVCIKRKDGQLRWLHSITRPIRDANGQVTAAIGVAHDITQRKLAEVALRESQLALETIALNSPDWLLLLDTHGRIQYANRPLVGIPMHRQMGQRLTDLTPKDSSEYQYVRQFVEQTLAGHEQTRSAEYGGHDGRGKRYFLHRSRPVLENCRVIGALITSTDVTGQQQRDNILKLQARVLETMREGVALIDTSGAVKLTNPAFDNMFRAGAGQLTGLSIETLLLTSLRSLQESTAALEVDGLRSDSTSFAAACVVTPMSIGDEAHSLLVLNDVSERKLLEREILEVSSLEQQRIGNDLHDGLGQELTGVALMLRALAAKIQRDYPQAGAEIDDIVSLVNHSIGSTRALARGLSPVTIERGGLLSALQTLILRARSAYGIQIGLRRLIRTPLRLDQDAATHIYRIVQEALTNAVRHGRATQISVVLISNNKHIELRIRDNGRGISQPGNRREGIGLKTMTYRAQMLRGQLSVAATPKGGTLVRCICPQSSDPVELIARSHQASLQVTRILAGS